MQTINLRDFTIKGSSVCLPLSGGIDDVFVIGYTTAVSIQDRVLLSGDYKMYAEICADGENATDIYQENSEICTRINPI